MELISNPILLTEKHGRRKEKSRLIAGFRLHFFLPYQQKCGTFTEALTVTSAISIVNGAISGNASFTMPESDYSFTDKAIDEVFGISTGIPRIIKRICEQSLTYAFQQRKKLVDDHMVRYVDEHEMLPV